MQRSETQDAELVQESKGKLLCIGGICEPDNVAISLSLSQKLRLRNLWTMRKLKRWRRKRRRKRKERNLAHMLNSQQNR